MTDVSQLYRVASIAKKFGVSRDTLKAHVSRGNVPFVRTACGLVLVTEASVQAWIERQKGKSNEVYGEQR